jgi:valine--pyruvate aminotransferase
MIIRRAAIAPFQQQWLRMQFSRFGEKFSTPSGILTLMEDISAALAGDPNILMLGGGNPASIAPVNAKFRAALARLAEDSTLFSQTLGAYDGPTGHAKLKSQLAEFFASQCRWPVSEANIAITNGSQNAFFTIFNMLAGRQSDGGFKRIVLPLAPEYIGYEAQSIDEPFFVSRRPRIDQLDARQFKYRVDFDGFELPDDAAAICVSRPTNPSGNVLTDGEIEQLAQIAASAEIPLIIDNAYGAPFPNIIHADVKPGWNDNTIMCLSLSKIGLPACRTGIVVAHPQIIDAIGSINAITNLAPGSIGAALALDLLQNDELIQMCHSDIRPFYAAMAERAVNWFNEAMGDSPGLAHKPEGAFFLWLWFPELPINSQQLYERLKARGVIIVPGHHFFPGLGDTDWPHRHECIRVSYAQPEAHVQRGMQIIAQEVKRAYSGD